MKNFPITRRGIHSSVQRYNNNCKPPYFFTKKMWNALTDSHISATATIVSAIMEWVDVERLKKVPTTANGNNAMPKIMNVSVKTWFQAEVCGEVKRMALTILKKIIFINSHAAAPTAPHSNTFNRSVCEDIIFEAKSPFPKHREKLMQACTMSRMRM